MSQSYHDYQCIYDSFFSFFTNNLNMPKIYHSRDAQEMFPYSSNCFIFILFNNSEYLTMTPIHFLPEKNQRREFSVECHGLLRIRLINYFISNHHILLYSSIPWWSPYINLDLKSSTPVLQKLACFFHNSNSMERNCSHFLTGLRLWNVTASLQ